MCHLRWHHPSSAHHSEIYNSDLPITLKGDIVNVSEIFGNICEIYASKTDLSVIAVKIPCPLQMQAYLQGVVSQQILRELALKVQNVYQIINKNGNISLQVASNKTKSQDTVKVLKFSQIHPHENTFSLNLGSNTSATPNFIALIVSPATET